LAYVQHRGGPIGFLKVLDEHTLAWADFRGDREYLSTGNVAGDARICMSAGAGIAAHRHAAVQAWLRDSGVPVLVVWGRTDEIFAPAGAQAFAKDSPHAVIELLDGGHFLLAHVDEVAASIRRFLPSSKRSTS